MSELKQDHNTDSQTQALTRFRALNFVEDLQRGGCLLAAALRQAALQPWPDENGDYYATRTIEDWWYAYKKGGFTKCHCPCAPSKSNSAWTRGGAPASRSGIKTSSWAWPALPPCI